MDDLFSNKSDGPVDPTAENSSPLNTPGTSGAGPIPPDPTSMPNAAQPSEPSKAQYNGGQNGNPNPYYGQNPYFGAPASSPDYATSPNQSVNPNNTDPTYGTDSNPYASRQTSSGSPYTDPFYGPQGGGMTPPPAPPTGKGNKKGNIFTGKNAGRNIFIVLICICIAVSSVAIGFSVRKNGSSSAGNSAVTAADNNTAETTGEGAQAKVEKSPTNAAAYSGSGTMTASQVYAAVKNINVGVLVYSNDQEVGEGSGIIVGVDSSKTYTYILTCAHVIAYSNSSVRVQFINGEQMDASVVAYDTKTDIGVVRVKKTGLTAATFGDSSALTVGQTVYAIGNPGGTEFFGSLTQGLVSALDRPIDSPVGYEQTCIQHSAAINPGNSGGALVNEYGQVVGMNSSKIANTSYENMSFAIPSNTILNVYNDLVKHGYVTNRAILGIQYASLSSSTTYAAIAWKNSLPYGSIIIAKITTNSDLATKGVQVNDIVTAIDGTELSTTDVLLDAIDKHSVGDTVTLTICRLNSNGSVSKTFKVKVKLVEDKGSGTTYSGGTTEPTTESFSSYFPGGF